MLLPDLLIRVAAVALAGLGVGLLAVAIGCAIARMGEDPDH